MQVDEIRGHIEAISRIVTNDLFQVMATVINHPQTLPKPGT